MPEREDDPHVEVFPLTAAEVAEEYIRRHEFRLATMNSHVREKMIDAIIEENGITGGWYWQACFPGWPVGPFATRQEALADAARWIEEQA